MYFDCSYQGMIKGYSGTFRLGEATHTLDADSPVSKHLFGCQLISVLIL